MKSMLTAISPLRALDEISCYVRDITRHNKLARTGIQSYRIHNFAIFCLWHTIQKIAHEILVDSYVHLRYRPIF